MEWISTKDRLPDLKKSFSDGCEFFESDYVLVFGVDEFREYGEEKQVFIASLEVDDAGYLFNGWSTIDGIHLENITHWMPLPEAPEE